MTNRCTICGMPLVEGGHNCPALTTMPSRYFLIRQAVLTAAMQNYPCTLTHTGWQFFHDRMRDLARDEFTEANDFRRAVASVFNVLLEKHGGAPCR